MKIYIAAKYDARFELQKFARSIALLGHELTCDWLFEGENGKGIEEAAVMDAKQVEDCDCLIFVGEAQGSRNTGGGRWFEMGVAWARGHKIIAYLNPGTVDGGRPHLPEGHESVFTSLPEVEIAWSQDDVLNLLGEAKHEPE